MQEVGHEDHWSCIWAVRIFTFYLSSLICLFSYGSKGHVEKIYEHFAEFYTNKLAPHAIASVMNILSKHAEKIYVSERVLHLSISHLAEALSHGQVWKTIKDHLMVRDLKHI